MFQHLLNLPWDFGWVGSEPGLCRHGHGICCTKPRPDWCAGEMHISDAGNIMVNTGSGCKSILWFDWDVWSPGKELRPWEQLSHRYLVSSRAVMTGWCETAGRKAAPPLRVLAWCWAWPVPSNRTWCNNQTSRVCAGSHSTHVARKHLEHAKDEVHGLFILNKIEMASCGWELLCGQF